VYPFYPVPFVIFSEVAAKVEREQQQKRQHKHPQQQQQGSDTDEMDEEDG
jgi:hypothetical protein